MNFVETVNVYHAIKYLLHNYIGMLMNLITDTYCIPIDKVVDPFTLNVFFQTCFAELHVDEIEDSISFELSAI